MIFANDLEIKFKMILIPFLSNHPWVYYKAVTAKKKKGREAGKVIWSKTEQKSKAELKRNVLIFTFLPATWFK